jgi:hypothetical protein
MEIKKHEDALRYMFKKDTKQNATVYAGFGVRQLSSYYAGWLEDKMIELIIERDIEEAKK